LQKFLGIFIQKNYFVVHKMNRLERNRVTVNGSYFALKKDVVTANLGEKNLENSRKNPTLP
jgi:hypothetical protein